MKTRKKALALVLTLAMLAGVLSAGMLASAAVPTFEGVSMQFGEPDPDYAPTLPESAMTITGSNGAYTANYTGADSLYYYPDTLSLYAAKENTNLTLVGSGVKFATYTDTVETLHDSITSQTNTNDGVTSDLFTLKIQSAGTVTVKDGADTLLTLSFSAPKEDYPTVSGTPTGFMGYLPLGQYASGSGWGSPYSDGTVLTGSTPKIVGGYSGTGVSLGAAGGYVQYDMGGFISDDPANPYGVDFIVYGNAFNGNPEAASVQVSQDGVKWYELAGSLYYADKTMRNATISYQKRADGIYYTLDGTNWTLFKNSLAWWPEYTDEGYGNVYGGNGSGVLWSTDRNTITFSGVTLVKDTDITNDYQFGYADVHINGSSYGAAVNPYSITNTGNGGDGFDIAWAVNADGTPANLPSIRYIRVYTSAALDSTGAAMTVPSIFGETSAEVCGIYKTTNAGGSAATTDLRVMNSSNKLVTTTDKGVTAVAAGTYRIRSTEENVYLNGVKISASSPYGFTVAAGEVYQIITQNGTESPYITVLRGV